MPFKVLDIYLEYNVQKICEYRFLFPKTRSNKKCLCTNKNRFLPRSQFKKSHVIYQTLDKLLFLKFVAKIYVLIRQPCSWPASQYVARN